MEIRPLVLGLRTEHLSLVWKCTQISS